MKFKCFVFGHNWTISKRRFRPAGGGLYYVNYASITCDRCGKEWS